MTTPRHLVPLLGLLAALALGGCAATKPFDYQTVDNRPGPGLFTGSSGKFVVYGGGDSH